MGKLGVVFFSLRLNKYKKGRMILREFTRLMFCLFSFHQMEGDVAFSIELFFRVKVESGDCPGKFIPFRLEIN